jgi:hypothetical protein
MIMFSLNFSAPNGTALLGGEPVILHCNHYNAFLQRTILDPDYVDCRPVLIDAATEVAHSQLTELFSSMDIKGTEKRLHVANELYRYLGFGVLDFSKVTETGGIVYEKSSHYSFACKNKFGPAKEPMAFFDTGFIAGALAAAIDAPPGHFQARQRSCIAQGAETNSFEVSLSAGRQIFPRHRWGSAPTSIPKRTLATPVDEDGIVSALAQMPIAGNEEGLIPAFGVVLTRMYADYYNRISFEFEHALEKATGETSLASLLLIEAGHTCAFNTFGGIMESDEWYGLIKPMCRSREDWVHGMVAVINALGWGIYRVHELVGDKRLVIRVYNGYEANGYLAMYGKAKTPQSFLATAATAGIMNLIYQVDISQKPKLDEAFYNKTFTEAGAFSGVQTKCRAMGDDFDEFVAERS